MARGKRITVLIPSTMAYGHQVASGIGAEIAKHSSWQVSLIGPRGQFLHRVMNWGTDGIIAFVSAREMADHLAEATIPVVNFSGNNFGGDFPSVHVDDEAVGTMAAEYLFDLGLEHFGVQITHRDAVPTRRREGFLSKLRAKGVSESCLHVLESLENPDGEAQDRCLREWLTSLPNPTGILAWQDQVANAVAHAADEAGLDIPNQIALLGVDDDPLMCHLTNPPLSSVRLPGHQVGIRAVHVLADLMAGCPAPTEPLMLPPLGVSVRGSTDILAIDDVDIATAVCLIRQRATRGLTIGDVLETIPLSRRTLERRFRQRFGRSPGEEIRRLRITRAKALLIDTDLTMPHIAQQCSFHDSAHFSRIFRQVVGVPPTQWRRLHQPPG